MADFVAKRAIKSHIQTLNGTPEQIFPLLCPVMEYKWIQPWKCDLIFTDSGFAEDNCVFKTDSPDGGEPETWIVSQYLKNQSIQFVRFNSSRVIRYNIFLADNPDDTTTAVWEQIITGLNEAGNQFVDSYSDEEYEGLISTLEEMLNHYLATGEMLKFE